MVKPEKQEEHAKLLKRFLKYMKENPKLFKEMKSTKTFTQTFGGTPGAYASLTEYASLADFEKLSKKMLKDAVCMKLNTEFMLTIDPATLTDNIWTQVE